ncbi:MAG: CPBP family intramembrane metalloprotease [Candidatus Pacebacteria bacterium]|nr:CPBP family intramembrane metalloprotease [Candidatus Paceibacterota bacterium]
MSLPAGTLAGDLIRDRLKVMAVVAGMVLFALLCHEKRWPQSLSLMSLAAVAAVLGSDLKGGAETIRALGLSLTRRRAYWLAVGCIGGVGFAVVCRTAYHTAPLPDRITAFALVAATIGSTEELLFRGWLQGRLLRWRRPLTAAILAAAAHAAYKCALFIRPAPATSTTFLVLASGTLIVGTGIGLMRNASRSVWPCILGHAVFDVLVYGAFTRAPWWVWN